MFYKGECDVWHEKGLEAKCIMVYGQSTRMYVSNWLNARAGGGVLRCIHPNSYTKLCMCFHAISRSRLPAYKRAAVVCCSGLQGQSNGNEKQELTAGRVC